MGFELRPYQKISVDKIKEFLDGPEKSTILVAPTGCHSIDTGILMYDGSVKKVQDVIIGDILMGDDNSPRTVLQLCKGNGPLYKVTPKRGIGKYIINEDHIMPLSVNNYDHPGLKYNTEISVKDFMLKSKNFKRFCKIRQSSLVYFPNASDNILDPYLLGVLLGDGSLRSTSLTITTCEPEILSYCQKYASENELKTGLYQKKDNKAFSISFSKKSSGKTNNSLAKKIKELGLFMTLSGTKFIPKQYLSSSVQDRKELLAGILDTDGYMNIKSDDKNTSYGYDIVTKSEQLSKDIAFLCRSLGLLAKITKCRKSCQNNFNGEYFRLSITGNIWEIPFKVERRKCPVFKNQYTSGEVGFKIEPIGNGDFYGFSLSGNKLYLTEDFVIHHNSGKSILIAETAIMIDAPLIVLQPSALLLAQNYEKYTSYGFKAEMFSASLNTKRIGRVTFATIGSIVKYADMFKQMGVKHVIIDECDWAAKSSNQTGVFLKALNVKKVIGFTATALSLSTTMAGSSLKMLHETRGSIVKSICHVIQCKEMTDGKFWTPIDYRHIDVNTSMLKLNTTGNDYTQETLNKYLEENDISKHIYHYCEKMQKAKHILVFVDSIEYAEEMAQHIPGAVAIHSKLDKSTRDEYTSGFFSGKYRVCLNVGVMAVGVDFPKLQVIIHARPTNSIRIWYQTVGRIVRIHPDKPICLVIDLSGNLAKFGKIEELVYENHPTFGWILRNSKRILTTNSKVEAYNSEKIKRSSHANYKITFGKYNGRRIVDIYSIDKKYLEWMAFGEFTPKWGDQLTAKETVIKFLS